MTEEKWHEAFVRWFDHMHAGHRIRAALWGWITDRRAAALDGTSTSAGGES